MVDALSDRGTPAPLGQSSWWSPRGWLVDADAGVETIRRKNAELPEQSRVGAETEAFVVLMVATACLTVLNFAATTQPTWLVTSLHWLGADQLGEAATEAFQRSTNRKFNGLAFWATVQILSYMVLPLAVVKLAWRRPLSHYGLTRSNQTAAGGLPYLMLFLVAVPFVAAAATNSEFQDKYPFLDLAAGESLWPFMFLWWILYAAQFVALEFFFRGFLIHGLAPALGMLAVPVMVVPYTMLHFEKPMLEAIAAIAGGLMLGTLALKARTIWWGALLHLSIALVMDVTAIGLVR